MEQNGTRVPNSSDDKEGFLVLKTGRGIFMNLLK